MARTQRFFCATSCHILGMGKGALPGVGVAWGQFIKWLVVHSEHFHMWIFASLLLSAIIIVVITVHFSHHTAVCSKLSFSQYMIFIFCASNSPLHPTAGGKGRGRMFWSVSVGTLNWEMPFLNHDSYYSLLCNVFYSYILRVR